VVIDPYSRYVFAHPTMTNSADSTFAGLRDAMQSAPKEIYEYFRHRVETFTVDGGVEFQGFLPNTYIYSFQMPRFESHPKRAATSGDDLPLLVLWNV